MQYQVFETYNLCRQIWITTRPKLVLYNFFLSFLCGRWCVCQPMKRLKYIRCLKFDLKINNNNVYNYIVESISYLLAPGGSFPSFLKALSFPSSTRDFHSLHGINGGFSYLGFLSRWTLNWSLTIFICWPNFFRTSAGLKVLL